MKKLVKGAKNKMIVELFECWGPVALIMIGLSYFSYHCWRVEQGKEDPEEL